MAHKIACCTVVFTYYFLQGLTYQLIFHSVFQFHILLERVEDAVKDFEKSVKLSPSFAVAHVQKCYTG
jgi:hypothetical protein